MQTDTVEGLNQVENNLYLQIEYVFSRLVVIFCLRFSSVSLNPEIFTNLFSSLISMQTNTEVIF